MTQLAGPETNVLAAAWHVDCTPLTPACSPCVVNRVVGLGIHPSSDGGCCEWTLQHGKGFAGWRGQGGPVRYQRECESVDFGKPEEAHTSALLFYAVHWGAILSGGK